MDKKVELAYDSNSEIKSIEENILLQWLQKGILETTKENSVIEKEMLNLLHQLHLEPKTLSTNIKNELLKASSILKAEKLPYLDKTTLQIAMKRKLIEETKKMLKEKKSTLKCDSAIRKKNIFLKRLQHVQEAVNSLEDFVNDTVKNDEDLYCDQIFMNSKLKEYQQAVEKLAADVDRMGIKEVFPEVILNKYKELLELSEKLEEFNDFLNVYNDLPPDLLQAKIMLENKKKEYESIEQTFLEKIS